MAPAGTKGASKGERVVTLLVTELSTYGIVMVAETGLPPLPALLPGCAPETEPHAPMVRGIPWLQAGIAAWGCRCVPTRQGCVGAGAWLDDVLQRYRDARDIAEFAGRLLQELSRAPRLVEEPMGFHIAGYVMVEGEALPALYYVRNSETDFHAYHLHRFRVTLECPPKRLGDEVLRSASSDIGGYGRLWAWAERELPAIEHRAEPGLPLPQHSLDGKMASLIARMRYVSGLYASGNPDQVGHSCHEVLGIPPVGAMRARTIRETEDEEPAHVSGRGRTMRRMAEIEMSGELRGTF